MRNKAILLLLLSLFLLVSGQAQVSVQEFEDPAGILHPELLSALSEVNQSLEQDLNIRLRLIARDFLGRKNPRTYAEQSLDPDGDRGDLLLVMVIGEERYEFAMNQPAKLAIQPDKVESMLLDSFREPFLKERDYSKAVAAFALNLADTLLPGGQAPRQAMNRLREFAGLASMAAPAAVTAAPSSQDSWLDSIFEDYRASEQTARQYDDDAKYAEEDKGGGLSLFQIALIGFILYKIFGKKRPGKKGCGPLGWIFGTWGFSKFFGWRK